MRCFAIRFDNGCVVEPTYTSSGSGPAGHPAPGSTCERCGVPVSIGRHVCRSCQLKLGSQQPRHYVTSGMRRGAGGKGRVVFSVRGPQAGE